MAKKQPPKNPTSGLSDAALAAFLFLAALAAYLPALQGTLLWDDDQHVTPPAMQSLHGLWRIWFDLGATAQYYPLLHSAFWLEHQLWGSAVLPYHLLNVTLHAGSAFLVVLIARELKLPGATLSGFVFALHPVCVEAVAWISEQKSTLSAVFVLGSALLYLRYDETHGRRTRWQAFALFVLALLSKTTAATLPAVLLVILWWKRGLLRLKQDVLPLAPFFAVSIPAGLLTAWVERRYIGAQGVEFALSVEQRILLAGRALWFYAGKIVWPAGLTFSYPRWRLDPAQAWQWLFPASVLAVAIALAILARKRRGPLAAFLIFSGTLFPALGFLNVYPFRYSYVADHFQYLATLGIIVPLVSVLTLGIQKIHAPQLRTIAPVVLAASLGLMTFRQSANYADSETLYRATLARNPESWLAHNNLGSILVGMPGRLDDAVAEYEDAIRIEPGYPEAHFNLGAALMSAHDPSLAPRAISEYETALRLKPGYAQAHSNLGNALLHMPDRRADAETEFRAALRVQPDMVQAHLGLGNALATAGRFADAAAEYRTALRLDPSAAEAHFNLGNVLLQLPGELPNAIAEYQSALRLRPDLDAAREILDRLGSR